MQAYKIETTLLQLCVQLKYKNFTNSIKCDLTTLHFYAACVLNDK